MDRFFFSQKNLNSIQRIIYIWDIENCSIPRGYSADEVVKNIRSIIGPGKKELSFTCFMDVTQVSKEITEGLYFANVTMNHVPNHKPGAIDQKIALELLQLKEYFQHDNTTVVLISGDIDFVQPLQRLKNDGFDIIVVHNQQAKKQLISVADKAYCWDDVKQGKKSNSVNEKSKKQLRTYSCSECDKEFNSDDSLQQHIAAKHVHACSSCSRTFKSDSALQQHLEAKHSWDCDVCDEVCETEDNWVCHNDEMAHWICSRCDDIFANLPSLEIHENYYGHGPSDDESNEESEEKEESYYHESDDEGDDNSEDNGFECPYCERVFGSERALQQHQNDTGHFIYDD